MSANLRLVDGRTVAVREDVTDIIEIMRRAPEWHEFKMADNTQEVRRIRLSAIIEYGRGHSK